MYRKNLNYNDELHFIFQNYSKLHKLMLLLLFCVSIDWYSDTLISEKPLFDKKKNIKCCLFQKCGRVFHDYLKNSSLVTQCNVYPNYRNTIKNWFHWHRVNKHRFHSNQLLHVICFHCWYELILKCVFGRIELFIQVSKTRELYFRW